MTGFGGYLAGWLVYILSVLGLLYFSFGVLGGWRKFLISKMIWALVAAILLAPWKIEDVDAAYWAPAAVAGLIQGVSSSPQEALVHLKPIGLLLGVFWSVVVISHFLQKRKKSLADSANVHGADSESA